MFVNIQIFEIYSILFLTETLKTVFNLIGLIISLNKIRHELCLGAVNVSPLKIILRNCFKIFWSHEHSFVL